MTLRSRLAFGLLMFVPVVMCHGQDIVITTAGEEISGRVLQATQCFVKLELPAPPPWNPAPPAGGPRLLSWPAEQIAGIRWGADPVARAEAENVLIPKWIGLLGIRTTSRPVAAITRDVQASEPRPAVIANLERLLVANDPRLCPPEPEAVKIETRGPDGQMQLVERKPPSRGTLAEPILEALISVCWWRQESLVVDLIGPSYPPRLRQTAMRLLESVLTPRSIPELARYVDSKDREVSRVPQYLSRLSREGYMDQVLVAVQPLLDSPDGWTRWRGLQCLEGGNLLLLGDQLSAAAGDEFKEVRRLVARALGESEEPSHGQILLGLVERDDDPITFQSALESLGRSRFLFVVPRLIELGQAETDPERQQKFIGALQGNLTGGSARYGDRWDQWQRYWDKSLKSIAESQAGDLTPAELAAMLDSTDAGDRITALRELAPVRYQAYLSNDEIMSFVGNGPAGDAVRIAALDALVKRAGVIPSRSSSILDQLISLYEAENSASVRDRIRTAMVRVNRQSVDLGNDAALWRRFLDLYVTASSAELAAQIERVIGDSTTDSSLVVAALTMAANRKLTDLTEPVRSLLTSARSDPEIKRECLRTLGEIATTESVDVLETLADYLVNLNRILSAQAHGALIKITGQRIRLDQSDWLDYIDTLGQ